MGGWTGEGKDTIEWDGTIRAKNFKGINEGYTPLPSNDLTNSITNLYPSFGNPKFISLVRGIDDYLPAGSTTLYTVPQGRRALIFQYLLFKNNTVGAITAYATNGTKRFTASVSISANNWNPISFNRVLEYGENLTVVTSAQGLVPYGGIVEFDDDSPLKTIYNATLPDALTTIYTCPAGKIAFPVASPSTNYIGYSVSITIYNSTLSSATISVYQVKAGDSPDTVTFKNRIAGATTTNANSIGSGSVYSFVMQEGDSIVLGTNVTGEILAYFQIEEVNI